MGPLEVFACIVAACVGLGLGVVLLAAIVLAGYVGFRLLLLRAFASLKGHR